MRENDKIFKSLTSFFICILLALNVATIAQLIKLKGETESDNAYMIEQVKKLDESVIIIEGILEDQHTINDELANRLGHYMDNVRAVNELLAKLKE